MTLLDAVNAWAALANGSAPASGQDQKSTPSSLTASLPSAAVTGPFFGNSIGGFADQNFQFGGGGGVGGERIFGLLVFACLAVVFFLKKPGR